MLYGSHKTYGSVNVLFKTLNYIACDTARVVWRSEMELNLKLVHNDLLLSSDCVKIKYIKAYIYWTVLKLKRKKYICVCVCMYVCMYIYIYIQGVPGGMCQTSGGCSLC